MKPDAARPPLASVALVSAAALGYEVLLVRLLSIVHWHHFAYMIISVALLGYGVSGTFLALAQDRLRGRFEAAYIANAALFGVAAIGGFLAAQSLPFNALEVLWDPVQPLWLAALYLLLFLPFFFAANCICLALGEFGARVHTTYAVDLVGAGAGAVGIILVLYAVVPMTALRIVAAAGLVAAVVACLELRAGTSWLKLALLAGAAALLLPWPGPRLALSPYKGLSQALEVTGAERLTERSSPLGLVTAVRSDQVPFRHAPGLSLNAPSGPPPQLALFTDGDGMQAITRFDGDAESLTYLGFLTSALPYHLLAQPAVLVLGSGTGVDVLQALHLGAAGVTAVELNPEVIDLVEGTFGEYSGRPYSDPRVRLHLGDARGFIAGSEQRFDLVQVPMLEAFGAASAGLQALGENYLHTVESFGAMLGVLKPGGLIAVNHWLRLPPREGLKAVAIAAAALEAAGVRQPGRHMAMIRGWNTTTLLIGNRPLRATQIDRLREFCEARSFDLVHYPGMTEPEANRYNRLQQPWYYQGVRGILGAQAGAFFDDYKFDIRPATDDKPYFSRFLKLGSVPEILRLRGQGGLPLLEQGYLVLILTLAQAAVIGVLLVLLPLARRRPGRLRHRGRTRTLAYFVLVGTAFMLVEIAFIQKFFLFLNHPIITVATVLGAFLVFAGLGSALSARWPSHRSAGLPVIGIATIALLYLVALPGLFEALLPLPEAARIGVSVLLTAPLAVPMGMPFPLGLRRLAATFPDLIPWAWGVNGCASVISAVGATLLAIHAGFTVVVVLAVLFYGLAVAAWPGTAPDPGKACP